MKIDTLKTVYYTSTLQFIQYFNVVKSSTITVNLTSFFTVDLLVADGEAGGLNQKRKKGKLQIHFMASAQPRDHP